MIKRVDAAEVMSWLPTTEAAVRQLGLFAAYGADRDFLRFYSDDIGNRLSVFDQSAVLDIHGDSEEMRLFLTMSPDIRYVRTDKETARQLAQDWRVVYKTEAVMEAPAVCQRSRLAVSVEPRLIFDVLQNGFEEGVPTFEEWYADVHHRYRRGLCECIGVYDDDRLAACAMTVAQNDQAALIGAVTTLPQYRGKGYASACVLTLSSVLQERGIRVLLSPKNEYAHRLYNKIGFTVVGEWGSVEKG